MQWKNIENIVTIVIEHLKMNGYKYCYYPIQSYSFIVWWYIDFCGLFKAKSILVEKQ